VALAVYMSASSGFSETDTRFGGPNKLGFQLFRLIKEAGNANFVISPLSIEFAQDTALATGATVRRSQKLG
jgi:hypothetical protein